MGCYLCIKIKVINIPLIRHDWILPLQSTITVLIKIKYNIIKEQLHVQCCTIQHQWFGWNVSQKDTSIMIWRTFLSPLQSHFPMYYQKQYLSLQFKSGSVRFRIRVNSEKFQNLFVSILIFVRGKVCKRAKLDIGNFCFWNACIYHMGSLPRVERILVW